MQKTILLVLFIHLSNLSLLAQTDLTRATDLYRKGEVALLEKDYNKAIKQFLKALNVKPDLRAAQRGIGFAHAQQNNYKLALSYYLDILENDPNFSRVLYYQVGDAYYKIGEHQKAIFYFGKFESLQLVPLTRFTVNGEKERELELDLLQKLPQNIQACQISLEADKFQEDILVTNMGSKINSRFDEYFPFLSNDQQMMFYTMRKGFSADENLHYSFNENGKWRNGSPVGTPFNTHLNEGMCTMVRDGRTLYFTACNRDRVLGPCDIWVATVDKNKISDIRPLEGYSNSTNWESQAAISCDGSTLYFASNREGGYGGTDIWYSQRLSNGTWSEPINMGEQVNTAKDEESPFITNDGRTLYFCSTGHLGLGETDLFMSLRDNYGNWTQPVNLGPKINTPYRELGFFLSADGQTGYFASDRPGGYGGMDIYKVDLSNRLSSEPITFVEGYVRDSLTGEGLQTSVVIPGRNAVITDTTGRFFLCLRAGSTLDVFVEEPGYHTFEDFYEIPEWDNKSFFPLEIELIPTYIPEPEPQPVLDTIAEPRRVVVTRRYYHTIYFKFDSDEVEFTESQKLLDFAEEVVGKRIQRVEINGYADDIGEDSYNLELSERRAKRIALFMYEQGIPIDRIAMRGYGEIADDRPKNENRRVELKIYTLE